MLTPRRASQPTKRLKTLRVNQPGGWWACVSAIDQP